MRKLYKHLKCSGVYGVREIETGLYIYIGSAININNRWRKHRTCTAYDDDFHILIRQNPDKYECVVLYKYDGVIKGNAELYKILVPIECELIKEYKANGHPIMTTVENNLGTKKHNDKTKTQMSESHKKLWEDPDYYDKMCKVCKETNNRPDVIEKQRKIQLELWSDPSRREKQREKQLEIWEDPSRRNMQSHRSKLMWSDPEYKKRMSEKHKGRIWITNDIDEVFELKEKYDTTYDKTVWRTGRKKRA